MIAHDPNAAALPSDVNVNKDSLTRLWQLALTAGGAGVALGGVGGLVDMMKDRSHSSLISPAPTIIDLPYPARKKQPSSAGPSSGPGLARKNAMALASRVKQADEEEDGAGTPAGAAYNPYEHTGLLGTGVNHATRWLTDVTSRHPKTWHDVPWMWPAVVGTGAGALYGGHKLMDWLRGVKKKRDAGERLEDAQTAYRQAMISQYQHPKQAHAAQEARTQLPELLDRLASLYEKQGGEADQAKGLYLTLASLLAAGSGIGTYHYMRGRDPDVLLDKAIKERERQRWAKQPPEVYIRPHPVEQADELASPLAGAGPATMPGKGALNLG